MTRRGNLKTECTRNCVYLCRSSASTRLRRACIKRCFGNVIAAHVFMVYLRNTRNKRKEFRVRTPEFRVRWLPFALASLFGRWRALSSLGSKHERLSQTHMQRGNRKAINAKLTLLIYFSDKRRLKRSNTHVRVPVCNAPRNYANSEPFDELLLEKRHFPNAKLYTG